MRMLRLALALATSLFAAPAAHAADIAPGIAGRCDIVLKGVLRDGDGKNFSAHLASLTKQRQLTLCLDSGGGDYLEALEIIRAMIDSPASVATRIEKGARCLSACALVFLAGHQGVDDVRPARTMDARAQLAFHGPYLPPDDAGYDASLAPLAYQAGVQAIGELMVLSTDLDLFPETLLVEALDKDPGAFLLIDTVDKAGRWSISVDGTEMPGKIDRRMLYRACVNDEDWRLGEDGGASGKPEPAPTPLRFQQGKVRAKFDGFGDEAGWTCTADAVEIAPGRYAIDLQWTGGFNDPPLRSVEILQRNARAANTVGSVGKPLWIMQEKKTRLGDIAAR